MSKILWHYLRLWNQLKGRKVTSKRIASALGIEIDTTRVLISRMLKKYMLHSPGRGIYRVVSPGYWIALQNLFINYPPAIKACDGFVRNSGSIEAIVVHGSHVTGKVDEYSDLDILMIGDINKDEFEKYEFPLSIEIQSRRRYDKIYVKNAISSGDIIYDSGILNRVRALELSRGHYRRALRDIQLRLFKLDDERLFESLSMMDLAHLLYTILRQLSILVNEMHKIGDLEKTERKLLRINPKIVRNTKKLYRASKARKPLVPEVTRKDLRKLRESLIEKWVEIKAEAEG